ncbi:Na+/H+ antiporter subunit G [Corynebacterium doosanense]|uniref:Cation:proton antiporter n=1 Tax=Corynebacterium doosanense CAU 212 = DSM 45436 TaxID=558173 RepID=A0A097IDA9_9CORY|nr:Na+/H+ antiporter subunit G [Corynebacterium doosanense]AIT60116.1 cation:proton antiporter [Corynebacterium doosanense CAU 212 = DSM 45436]
MTIVEIIVAALVVLAAFMTAATAIAQWRAPDALTRVNLMGPLVCVAFPVLLVAKLIWDWSTEGFDPANLLRALIAIAGVWIVASIGSFYLARGIYGVTVVDRTGLEGETEGAPEGGRG